MTPPSEKPDPLKDYEAYKAWRKAQKGGGAAPAAGGGAAAATAEPEKPAQEKAPEEKAEAAPAEKKEEKKEEAAKESPGKGPADDPMPHPINEYDAYKAWKARQKAGAKKTAAPVAEGESRPTKKKAPHASKFKKRETDRRSVLVSFGGLMWLLFAGGLGVMGAALGRFFFPNVLYEPPTTFKIGRPSDFIPNTVDTSFKAARQIWVVRDALGIYVLKAVCTHLGCTPNWLSSEEKFKCPCHGSGFRMTGMNFEGPAPRPLERYKVAVADDGQILVDTSKTFLQESDWTNPEAYVPA